MRHLGFAIVYGTVTLKMYRVLKVFLSRTAQRVPYMSSIHVLRVLGVMVVIVSWFLCAWTVGVLQNRDRNIPLTITSTTSDGQGFSVCDLDRWDYMMAVAELLFLCWGCFLCSAVKPVPSAFHEPRYMGIAIHNELLLSSMFHLLRFVMPSLHPDWMLLLFFIHTHVTITVTLALLLIPKFLHVSRAGREEIAEEVYEDEVDLRRSGSYLNTSFTSAVWTDHSLDPDDIRDELKKLYAHLEVHKTKKMTTNNPHLPKKRSSRRGLGRSIIKRISEIPESMSRQCSREDKEVNLGSRGFNHSESCKKVPDAVSVNYTDESAKHPPAVLRKSRSDYDNVKDAEPSSRDVALRASQAKRCSQRSETDSLDNAPLVCKSASALNLTVENDLLLPEHHKLHKSLSLVDSRAHSMDDASRVGRGTSKEQRQSKQDVTIKKQTSSALVQSQSYDKAEVCPWEMEEESPYNRNQPHVTFAPAQKEPPQSPERSLASKDKHVCPWDHLPDPTAAESSAVESHVGEAESVSPKPQALISASAPGSPKDVRVFPVRTSKWRAVKALLGSMDTNVKDKLEDTVKAQESISQDHQGSLAVSSPSTALKARTPSTSSLENKTQRVPKLEKKSSIDKNELQKSSTTTTDAKPALVKQAAISLSSSDSSERSPRRLLTVQATNFPLDPEDMQKERTCENVFPSGEIGACSTAKTASTHRRGMQVRCSLSVPLSDICPWDVTIPTTLQRKHSARADICPWEVEDPKTPALISVCPWESEEILQDELKKPVSFIKPDEILREELKRHRSFMKPDKILPEELKGHIGLTQPDEISPEELKRHGSFMKPDETLQEELKRQKSFREDVCPWEFTAPVNPSTVISSWSGKEPDKAFPWETDEIPQTSYGLKPQPSVQVCPWDVRESLPEKVKVEVNDENIYSQDDKGLSEAVKNCQGTLRVNVCPWETDNTASNRQTNTIERSKSVPGKPSITLTEACPWQVADPCKNTKELCPWEEEGPKQSITKRITKGSSSQETDVKKINLPTQVTGDKDSVLHPNVCPWEFVETTRQDSTQSNISEKTKEIVKQDSMQADQTMTDSLRANICPWEMELSENKEQQAPTLAGVSKDMEKAKKHASAPADVCPWETEATEEAVDTKGQDRTQSDICPWKTEGPKKTEKKTSIKVNIGTAKSGPNDKTYRRQSTKAYISKDTEKEKRRASAPVHICPWETALSQHPEKLKQQGSSREDVCPWETGLAEDTDETQRHHSARADICPWETEVSEASERTQKQDSVRAAVGPRGTDESEKSSEKEGTLGAMSMEEADDSAHVAKSNMPLARRDAICPWEMEGIKLPSSPSSLTEHDNNSDIFTWDPENIPEEEEDDDAESAAEAFIFPADL